MEPWLQKIIAWLPGEVWYLAVTALVTFAESLPIIGLLVPGSTLIVFAGLLAFHGKSTLLGLMIVAMAGAFLGDLLSFRLGTRYGSILLRMGIFQSRRRLVKQAETFFVLHGGKSIFFARFLGPIRGITPFIAGLSGMPAGSFRIYTLISALLWGISYPALGYLGGSSWQHAQSLTARFGLVIVILLIATLLHYWIKKRLHLSRKK